MTNLTRMWTMTRTNFHTADPVERWTARAAWALLTATAWLVLVFTVIWGAEVAGVPSGVVAWSTVVLSLAVPVVSMVAVTSGPGGRTRAPVLTAVLLLAAAVLVITFT